MKYNVKLNFTAEDGYSIDVITKGFLSKKEAEDFAINKKTKLLLLDTNLVLTTNNKNITLNDSQISITRLNKKTRERLHPPIDSSTKKGKELISESLMHGTRFIKSEDFEAVNYKISELHKINGFVRGFSFDAYGIFKA
jgi:hypothetical protein